jgi:hypothetical protein
VSKRTIARWYIGAWVVWFVALIAVVTVSRIAHTNASVSSGMNVAVLVTLAAGIVTFVMWVAALVKLARQQAMFWFVGVLVLQLIGLGIVGMVAYAVAGPEDTAGYVIRPSVT